MMSVRKNASRQAAKRNANRDTIKTVKSKISQNMKVIDYTNNYIKKVKQVNQTSRMTVQGGIDFQKLIEENQTVREKQQEALNKSHRAQVDRLNKSVSPAVSAKLNKSVMVP